MKKLINDPLKVTVESIEGDSYVYSDIVKLVSPHVVARRGAPISGKVGVIVGGGGEDEPLFMGWLSRGMADAAARVRCSNT